MSKAMILTKLTILNIIVAICLFSLFNLFIDKPDLFTSTYFIEMFIIMIPFVCIQPQLIELAGGDYD